MTLIGPYINSAAIFLGASIGAMIGGRIPEALRNNLILIFGLSSMGMGVVMISKVFQMPVIVLSVLIGTIIGEIFRLENKLNRLAMSAKGLIEKLSKPKTKKSLSQEEFLLKFVALVIMFSFSGTGVFGAMNEGIAGDTSILVVKSLLDFFTAIIFSTTLGISVATIVIPQLSFQLILAYSAVFMKPYVVPEMLSDFAAVGEC